MTTTVAVVGIHGFGGHHLTELASLAEEGIARVVAVADPRGPDGVAHVPDDVVCHPDLATLLQHGVPDVVVLATPIHTHAPLAIAALEAGADVLLEKPTTASLAELAELVAVADRTGRAVQVGFQSFGSDAFAAIEDIVGAGTIGEVTGIGGVGTWLRTRAYYARSRWAGRRTLDGVPVVDGVTTNPLAHAVASALKIAGAERAEDVDDVQVELFHAHDIEADDTSAVRVRTTSGITVALGLTLCAPQAGDATVVVHGSAGSVRFLYTQDVLEVTDSTGATTTQRVGRTSVLRNLIEHVQDRSVPLLAPAERTGAFMRVLEAVRTAPDPSQVPSEHVTWIGEGPDAHPVIDDVEDWCARVCSELRLFSELGAPWAVRPR